MSQLLSGHHLSRASRAYTLAVLALGLLASLATSPWRFFSVLDTHIHLSLHMLTATPLPSSAGALAPPVWMTFVVFTALAALGQTLSVTTPSNVSYHLTPALLFADILVLPPSCMVPAVALAFIPEWIVLRLPWYVQTFNMAVFIISSVVVRWLMMSSQALLGLTPFVLAVGLTLAMAAYLAVQHTLVALAVHMAYGAAVQRARVLSPVLLLTDATLVGLGVALATLWVVNPWLVGFGLVPLIAIYRSLLVPALQQQANSDTKTGLANAAHFRAIAGEELRRAQRFGRPLAIVIGDLDLLRNINNSYGHLAGDTVLIGIAAILQNGLRDYDLAARFGGEEFALLLPETDAAHAAVIAERLRASIEQARFPVRHHGGPIRATISMGVAATPEHGWHLDDLIHEADLATYLTKLRGRNGVTVASHESAGLTKEQQPDDGKHAYDVVVPPQEA